MIGFFLTLLKLICVFARATSDPAFRALATRVGLLKLTEDQITEIKPMLEDSLNDGQIGKLEQHPEQLREKIRYDFFTA